MCTHLVSVGRAVVLRVDLNPHRGTEAACYAQQGVISRGALVRVLRDDRVAYPRSGGLAGLAAFRQFDADVFQVRQGRPFGLSVEGFDGLRPGDVIEAYPGEQAGGAITPEPGSETQTALSVSCERPSQTGAKLPGPGSLPRPRRGPLTIEQILRWADAHHARTGEWPLLLSGPVAEEPGENWKAIDRVLRVGHRGLSGGSSLSRLLAERRGVPDGRKRRSSQARGWDEGYPGDMPRAS